MEGFIVGRVIDLIIGVILLIVLSPLVFRVASNVWDQLSESIGIVKYSPIERALICYYYLCREGCKISKFNDFCSADKIGRENYEEVCSLPVSLGVDGEQCRNAYWQFPMRIKLDSESELSMDKLKKKIEKEFVVIRDSNTEVYRNDYIATDFVYINDGKYMTDKEYWSYNRYFPLLRTVTIKNAIKFGKVKPDSSAYDIAGVIQDDGSIAILFGHFLTYYTFYDKSSYIITVDNGRIIRMSIEDEKTDNLKDYNYLMKLESEKKPTPLFYIKFWNWTRKDSPREILFMCDDITCSDKIGSQRILHTAKGRITIRLEDVKVDTVATMFGPYYIVRSVKLTTTYTKLK